MYSKTLLPIRLFFLILCVLGGGVIWYTNPDFSATQGWLVLGGSLGVGALTIIVDIALKGFSLRGLSAVAFGFGVGALIAHLVATSPLFENGDPRVLFIIRLFSFILCTYLSISIALRGRDEFNLVIPYIRFIPQKADVPLVVLDTSILIDGRIATLCQSRFLTATLIVPKFVIEELQLIGDAEDAQKQLKGRKGMEVLNKLRNMSYVDLRVKDVDLDKAQSLDSKIIYLAQTMKAKLMTMDYNLGKLSEFHGVEWLNLNALSKALSPDVIVGQYLDIELVKQGKEGHQGVGYLSDGSMVVVNEASQYLGKVVAAEIISILPSAGGKMIFARLHPTYSQMNPVVTA